MNSSKRLCLSVLFCLALLSGFASHPSDTFSKDTTAFNAEAESAMILETMDSLAALLFKPAPDPTAYQNPLGFQPTDIPTYTDSVYGYRLGQMETIIPMSYNEYVQAYIDMYAIKKRGQVQRMLGLSEIYFPLFEEVLDKHDLPIEFKYLAIVESALNPHAVSRVGATGLWQFMYRTGKVYGLEINSYVDDRRDPLKSTEAACQYFRNMYDIYGNWHLVIAAYNCGPGNVNKAIRRSGGKTDFWEIREYLPRETRGYVPAFIAAAYVMSHPDEHNFIPVQPAFEPFATDTVMINRTVAFNQISKYTNISEAEIAFLNPSYKKHVVPGSSGSRVLHLPFDRIANYDTYYDSIYQAAPEPVAPVAAQPVMASYSAPQPRKTYSYVPENTTKLVYTVKSGDNIGYIAEWYDCSTSSIRNWNGIYGNRIKVGQKLKIYKANDVAAKYQKVDHLSFHEKEAIEDKQHNRERAAAPPKEKKEGSYYYYRVKSGDTLWDIANKYPGTSIEDIKRLNNFDSNNRLKPGMIIKIEVRG